jgi:geminin
VLISCIFSELLQTPDLKRKAHAAPASSSTQTDTNSQQKITAEDLTSETPVSEDYWKMLAEKRRSALEETLTENQELYERIADLECELNQSKSMLEEARELVNVLTEMLNEKEGDKDENHTSEEGDEKPGELDVTM